MISVNLSLELLRTATIRAGSADRGLGLDSGIAIPPLVTVPPVLVDETLDILQVAPSLACTVSTANKEVVYTILYKH